MTSGGDDADAQLTQVIRLIGQNWDWWVQAVQGKVQEGEIEGEKVLESATGFLQHVKSAIPTDACMHVAAVLGKASTSCGQSWEFQESTSPLSPASSIYIHTHSQLFSSCRGGGIRTLYS